MRTRRPSNRGQTPRHGPRRQVARTTEPSTLIRLPGAPVRAQFAKPAGLAFLASTAWNLSRSDRPTIAPTTDSRPVGELVHGDALLFGPDSSVRDAVCKMTDNHAWYAMIRLPDGELGIFTDRDLRTRVVAADVSIDAPITLVMSAPARRVTADLTAETVLMDMLEHGVKHMPVVTARGDVVGVLEDADLLAASARQSFMLRRSIGLAGDAADEGLGHGHEQVRCRRRHPGWVGLGQDDSVVQRDPAVSRRRGHDRVDGQLRPVVRAGDRQCPHVRSPHGELRDGRAGFVDQDRGDERGEAAKHGDGNRRRNANHGGAPFGREELRDVLEGPAEVRRGLPVVVRDLQPRGCC